MSVQPVQAANKILCYILLANLIQFENKLFRKITVKNFPFYKNGWSKMPYLKEFFIVFLKSKGFFDSFVL